MRIAQVSTVWESVPPKGYGGVERVVSYLTEELVRQGHEVTLFASGDSKTSARLVPVCEQSVRAAPNLSDATPIHIAAIEQAYEHAAEFDVIHFHLDYLHFPLAHHNSVPALTTLHNRLDAPELAPLFEHFRDVRVVSISISQRAPAPTLNWIGNVYHGLPTNLYRLNESHEGYLAFIGRISREKRVDRAIRIAERTGRRLRIASKIDDAQKDYLGEIQPLLELPHVDFVGEVSDEDKQSFLGNAFALLFPIDWPEPFGLVMIESMACGTPVVAFENGAVDEVMTDGLTGFVVRSVDEAVEAVAKVEGLSRARCREHFEHRFDVARMTRNYLDIYRALTG